jgi:prepilin-type processing-associated H-X9-DG protein
VPKTYHYLGWQARVLPFIDQQPLWRRIEEAFRTAPDGSPRNPPHAAILAIVVPVFGCPADDRVRSPQLAYGTLPIGLTSYLGVVGINQPRRDGVLYVDSTTRLADITDGTSQTLLLGERPSSADFAFGWWYRGWGQGRDGSADMVLGVRERNFLGGRYPCPPGPYPFGPGKIDNQCGMFHFWSPHPGGAHFAFADGSVRFLKYSADPILPALATRAGGEAVSAPD